MISVFLRAVVFGLGVEAGREAYALIKSTLVGSRGAAPEGGEEGQASVQPVEASTEGPTPPSAEPPQGEDDEEDEPSE